MKRIVAVLLGLGLLLPIAAHADNGERITDFSSAVHVDKHNVVDITETIKYNFGDESHHGIYRDIPTHYKTADGDYYTEVAFKGVTVDGATTDNETSEQDDGVEYKIGDRYKTISGPHTYVLHYQLSPIVVQVNGRDRLLLDITGDKWQVPINHASATFAFDNGATLAEPQCYAGNSGSTVQNCQVSGMSYAASGLMAGQGLTVNGYLPNGYVDHYLAAGHRPWTAKRIFNAVAGIGITLLVLIVLTGLLIRSWVIRRMRNHQTVVAEYEAPDGLTPAEIGLLVDDKTDMKEITATLIDLAVRGYIKITQTRQKGFMRKAEYSLTKLNDYSGTENYETDLLNVLFGSETTIEMNRVSKTAVSKTISDIRSQLKKRLETKGYYAGYKQQKGIVRKLFMSGSLTQEGASEWAKVEGFKLYLNVAEKDRINFSDAPERTPERFNKLLPYAVALGVEKQWAKQFEGIDVAQNQNWYVSNYGVWTALNLADDMGGSFADVASSSFAAPSSSSGGGAGGGFGGGGGGSW